MTNSIWQVAGKRFAGRLYVRGDIIDDAEPVLEWMVGKTRQWLVGVCKKAGWSLRVTPLYSVPDEYHR